MAGRTRASGRPTELAAGLCAGAVGAVDLLETFASQKKSKYYLRSVKD